MYVPTSEDVPNEELKAVLERVAVNREVLAAVSNKALISEDGNYGMLKTWVDSVRASGVKNFMVVALATTPRTPWTKSESRGGGGTPPSCVT